MGTTKRRGVPKASHAANATGEGMSSSVDKFHRHHFRGYIFAALAVVLIAAMASWMGTSVHMENTHVDKSEADRLRSIFDPQREASGRYPVDDDTLGLLATLSVTAEPVAAKIRSAIQENPLQIGERLRLCVALEKHGLSSRERFTDLATCYRRLMESFRFAEQLPVADSRRQILLSMRPTVARSAGERMVTYSENRADRLSEAVAYLRAGVLDTMDCGDVEECRLACATLLLALHLQGSSQDMLQSTFQATRKLPGLKVDWQSPQSVHVQLPGIRHQEFWEPSTVPWLRDIEEKSGIVLEELERYIEKQQDVAWEHQPESGYLAGTRQWNSVEFAMNGEWHEQVCQSDFPKTCALIRDRPELNPANTKWPATVQDMPGKKTPPVLMANIYQALPGARIRAHFGTHGRLVASMGLKVSAGASLRVGGEIRRWETGRFLLFDDAFMHEVVNEATEPRYVLALALLHPECCDGCSSK